MGVVDLVTTAAAAEALLACEAAERWLGTRSRSGHGRRGGGRREELLAAHGYDTKYAMHWARPGFQGLELLSNHRLTLPIADEPGDWLRAVKRGDWLRAVKRGDCLRAVKRGDVPFDEWRRARVPA